MKLFPFSILLVLILSHSCFAQDWVPLGNLGQDTSYFHPVCSLSKEGQTLAIGDYSVSGGVKVFEWSGQDWVQKGSSLIGSGTNSLFGYSVDLSFDGNILAVGAPGISTDYVAVYEWSGVDWVQLGNYQTGVVSQDQVGHYIALNHFGDVLSYSTKPSNGGGAFQVLVLEWDGNNWNLRGAPIAYAFPTTVIGPGELSYSGDTISIRLTENGSEARVRMYEWDGVGWSAIGNDISSGFSGLTMNSAGNMVAVGHPSDGTAGWNAGLSQVFEWNGANWELKGDSIFGSGDEQWCGFSLSLNSEGNTIAVGSPETADQPDTGYVNVYQWVNASWQSKGTTIRGSSKNTLGKCVSLNADGNAVAVSDSRSVVVYSFQSGVGINKPNELDALSLVQNPTTGDVILTLPNPAKWLKASVFSVSGQIISQNEYSNARRIAVPLDQGAGLYFLSVRTGNETKSFKVLRID